MSFQIKKTGSISIGAMNTIDLFVKKVADIDPVTPNSPNIDDSQRNIIVKKLLSSLKSMILSFVDQISAATTSGNPKLSIDDFPIFDEIFEHCKALEDEGRDLLPSFGVDPTNLDAVLDILEEIASTGYVGNSKSRRRNLNISSTDILIQSLSSLMEISISDDQEELSDNPEGNSPAESVDTGRNIVEILVNGSNEERDAALQKYGLDLLFFQEFLIEHRFSTTSRKGQDGLLPQAQMKQAFINFIQEAAKQYSGNKIILPDEFFDFEPFIPKIKKSKTETDMSNSKYYSGNHVVLADFSWTDFFLNYFSSNTNFSKDAINPAMTSLMQDIAHYIKNPNSSVRNVSEPFIQEEVESLRTSLDKFGSSSNQEAEIKRLEALIAGAEKMLAKASEAFRPKIESQIQGYREKIEEMSENKTYGSLAMSLDIKGFDKKMKEQADDMIREMDMAYVNYKEKSDIGSAGLAVEDYIKLYNMNSRKDEAQAMSLSELQSSIINSPWYRFVSPAFRFAKEAEKYISLYGVKYSGVSPNSDKRSQVEALSSLVSIYESILAANDSSSAINLMKKFEFVADAFFTEASRVYASSSFGGSLSTLSDEDRKKRSGSPATKRTPANVVLTEMYKYLLIIRIVTNNPESVVMIKKRNQPVKISNRVREELKKTSDIDEFVIVQSFRIDRI